MLLYHEGPLSIRFESLIVIYCTLIKCVICIRLWYMYMARKSLNWLKYCIIQFDNIIKSPSITANCKPYYILMFYLLIASIHFENWCENKKGHNLPQSSIEENGRLRQVWSNSTVWIMLEVTLVNASASIPIETLNHFH